MNERLVFPLSALSAEFGASILLFLLLPDSPLTRHFPRLIGYLEAHALPSLGAWAGLILLSAALTPKLWRRRQNRASKLALLARIGALGLLIDLMGSLYLWLRANEEGMVETGSPVLSFVLRLGVYAGIFALVVAVSDQVSQWHARRNPPAATPPPRFGRA